VPFNLAFSVEYKFDTTQKGISIPVTLSLKNETIDFLAKVDTGADFCIFKREHGEALGLDIESGYPQMFDTVAGNFNTYGHELTLTTFNMPFDVMVYFAGTYGFRRNVLGRRGWLDQIKLGIIDYDGKVYVNKYE
jgi:hypothetical protein